MNFDFVTNKRVLFGAASGVLVDMEESCARCGFEVIAIVKDCECPTQALNPNKILKISELPIALLEHSWLFTSFIPGQRKKAVSNAKAARVKKFHPIIDPTAILPKNIDIAEGVYVNSGAVIGSKTSLNAFSFINRAVTLGHHNTIGEFVSFGPRVVTGGNVSIGNGSLIGIGAVILPEVKIGENVFVGGGAVVATDVPSNTMVVGNPAKIVRKNIQINTKSCS